MNEDNPAQEEVVEETEVADMNKPDFVFVPRTTHAWRQQGYNLICNGCDLQHGVFIGADKIMTGEDIHGQPILTERVDH